ncbi:MAG: terpene cyclase/mutase family protein [Actinobacteria bacterium]|nr:terpene cyclase/mutase family protein [Actinomycetota bacterium]
MTISTPSPPAVRGRARIVANRTMTAAAPATISFLILVLTLSSPALALTPQDAAPRALDYLHAQWKENGGFATNSPTGDLSILPWAVMAVSAAGYNPASWSLDSRNLVTVMRDMDIASEAVSGAGSNNTPAFYAKLILAFNAAGRPDLAMQAGRPTVSLTDELLAFRHTDTGHFSMSTANSRMADINTTIWAILALSALGSHQEIVEQAAAWLRTAQAADGGFSFQSGAVEDVDDTGAAIQALVASGASRDDSAVQAAVEFLRRYQNEDGGFASWITNTRSTAESTAWALQALNALGEDLSNWTRQNDPAGYLLSLQQPSGCFAHRTGQVATPLMTTTQAVIALAGHSVPFSLLEHNQAPDYRPSFSSLTPMPDADVPTNGFHISAEFTDGVGQTGINPAQIQVYLDGTALTLDTATVTEGSLELSIGTLSPGAHKVGIIIADYAGHVATSELPITATAPTTTTTHAAGNGSANGPTTVSRTTETTRAAGGATRVLTGGQSGSQKASETHSAYTPNAQTSRAHSTMGGTATPGDSSSSHDVAGFDGVVAGVRMGPASDADFPTENPEPNTLVTGEEIPTAPLPTDDGWQTGLLAGGIAALSPLGAGLSLVLHRRRSSLLADMFPAALAVEDASGKHLPPGDGPRTAWLQLQCRVRHHLTHLPLPDDLKD